MTRSTPLELASECMVRVWYFESKQEDEAHNLVVYRAFKCPRLRVTPLEQTDLPPGSFPQDAGHELFAA